MPLPESGSQEYRVHLERMQQRMLDVAYQVAIVRPNLPRLILIMIHDKPTGETAFTKAAVEYIGRSGTANVTSAGVYLLQSGESPEDIAHEWTQQRVTLVCDETTAQQLIQASATQVEDGHYQFHGKSGGILDIFTPPPSIPMDENSLPEGMSGILFIEKQEQN